MKKIGFDHKKKYLILVPSQKKLQTHLLSIDWEELKAGKTRCGNVFYTYNTERIYGTNDKSECTCARCAKNKETDKSMNRSELEKIFPDHKKYRMNFIRINCIFCEKEGFKRDEKYSLIINHDKYAFHCPNCEKEGSIYYLLSCVRYRYHGKEVYKKQI